MAEIVACVVYVAGAFMSYRYFEGAAQEAEAKITTTGLYIASAIWPLLFIMALFMKIGRDRK